MVELVWNITRYLDNRGYDSSGVILYKLHIGIRLAPSNKNLY
jgi:hypothetical protein